MTVPLQCLQSDVLGICSTETDESGKKSPRHSHLHLPFTHKDKTEKPSGGAEDNG